MATRKLAIVAATMLAGNAMAAEPEARTVSFVDSKGQAAGSAQLTAMAAGGVLIRLDLVGLPAGQWVAFHVHETGACDPTTGHKSAGGHFNPASKEHGYKSAGGSHAGDMPNQQVAADGSLQAEVFNPIVTLDNGESGIVGRALMIHAGQDDYESQPSGDAGDRLACGVIE